MVKQFDVRAIEYEDTKVWLLTKHYAQRMPSISYAYGLFDGETLLGVCTVGKPANPYLCEGVCGAEYKDKVYELNRLVLTEDLPRNTASYFIGKVLKILKPEDLILVSYSDEGMSHFGYIYQATNWIYTGKTKERTDKYMPGGKHSRHYEDKYKHLRKFRTSKHRYIYFTGKSKKEFMSKLKYGIEQYPKGDPDRYTLGEKIKEKIIDTKKNEVFYE